MLGFIVICIALGAIIGLVIGEWQIRRDRRHTAAFWSEEMRDVFKEFL